MGRVLVGELLGGAVAGPPRVVDRLLDVPTGEPREEVMRELRQVFLGPSRVESLHGLCHTPMQAYTFECPQLLVERLADQRVGEAVAAEGVRQLLDHARRDDLFE